MATTDFSERVAQFPIARSFRGVEWDQRIESSGQRKALPLHRKCTYEISQLKRSMDVAISVTGIVVLALPMLLLALLIKLDSSGPTLYRSERLGLKGRRINCTKFRTMVSGVEKRDETTRSNSDDARITRLGRLLRKYSLDEIPQLFDVLSGDMSIVGPRPPMAGEMVESELRHLRRLQITPGITGLGQVQTIEDPSFDSYVSLDLAYVQNWSPWLDAKVIAKTVGAVLAGTKS